MKANPPITREQVEAAMSRIQAEGERPSVRRIRNLTGGSDSTINRLKNEIEAEKAPPVDSEDALQAFRGVWTKALMVGAAQQAQALDDLRADYQSALDENERLEGRVTAAQMQSEKQEKENTDLRSQLVETMARETQSRANCESDARALAEALARLNALQERFAAESAQWHAQQEEATEKLHAAEIRGAGILSESERIRVELVAAESRYRQSEEQRNQMEVHLQSISTQLAEARTTNSELAHKLSDANARLSDVQGRYQEELPALRKQLATAVAKCHHTELQLARLHGRFNGSEHRTKKSVPKKAGAADSDIFIIPAE
ncbi:MAG: DNA-binding protein [Verrucomicrobiota bacterium]